MFHESAILIFSATSSWELLMLHQAETTFQKRILQKAILNVHVVVFDHWEFILGVRMIT